MAKSTDYLDTLLVEITTKMEQANGIIVELVRDKVLHEAVNQLPTAAAAVRTTRLFVLYEAA